MSIKRWYKSSEFHVGITLLILSGVGTIINDVYTSKKIFQTAISFVQWCWNTLISFLKYPVPVYWILLGIGMLTILAFIISKVSQKGEAEEAGFLNYKSDVLKQWKWTWDYELTTKGQRITNLTPHCMKCDYPMKYQKDYWGGVRAECPQCPPYTGPIFGRHTEDIDDIEMMISHRITTKQYPGAIQH